MNFEPRPFQQAMHDDQARFITAVIHRRAGKTVFAVDWLLEPCLEAWPLQPGYRGYYIAPFREQAAEVSLDYFIQFIPEGTKYAVNRNKLTIDFPDTGARIQMLGTEWNIDRHRGKYADRLVLDETAQIAPSAWREVFRPMLSDRNGRALFIGTVKGKNFFYDLYMNGVNGLRDWSSHLLRADESGILPPEELEALEAEMGPREYRREYLCDWDAGAPGAYFEEEMNIALGDERITQVPFDPLREVHTSWRFESEVVTVSLLQFKSPAIRVIESKRFMQETLPNVIDWVRNRNGYVWGRHYAGGKQLRADDHRISIARDLGVTLQVVEETSPLDSRIQLAKVKMRRMYFDELKAGDLVEGLRTAGAEYDSDTKTFKDTPVKNWQFDMAASLFPAIVQHNEKRSDWNRPIDYTRRPAA